MNTVVIDIDFSENLSVPVKFEPQSKHWDHEQVTVYLGILKRGGNKYYHPYFSNDKKHDQSFVKCVIDEMIKDIIEPGMTLIIESDNGASQQVCRKLLQLTRAIKQIQHPSIFMA